MWVADLDHLVCSDCRSPLTWHGANLELRVQEGALVCRQCRVEWSVRDGWPRFFREQQVRRRDLALCRLCDTVPALHDPAVQFVLPAALGGSPSSMRQVALRQMRLDQLLVEVPDRPVRVLEVGVSSGLGLAPLYEELPRDAEVWGTELSVGLLEQARRRCASDPALSRTRLLLADAHHLPFSDGFFDRVIHVGATGGLRDPAVAFAEMARVARRGTPVVAVVEKLDADRRPGPLQRLVFKWLADPHDPVAAIPAGATDRNVESVGRFHHCLAFRLPVAPPAR